MQKRDNKFIVPDCESTGAREGKKKNKHCISCIRGVCKAFWVLIKYSHDKQRRLRNTTQHGVRSEMEISRSLRDGVDGLGQLEIMSDLRIKLEKLWSGMLTNVKSDLMSGDLPGVWRLFKQHCHYMSVAPFWRFKGDQHFNYRTILGRGERSGYINT